MLPTKFKVMGGKQGRDWLIQFVQCVNLTICGTHTF